MTGFEKAQNTIMNTRPQTLGHGLADSPAALAAWIYDIAAWTYRGGEPERALTRDEMLDDITLYWLTNTGASSSESYGEVWGIGPFNAVEISIPVGVTVFPGESKRGKRCVLSARPVGPDACRSPAWRWWFPRCSHHFNCWPKPKERNVSWNTRLFVARYR